MSINLELRDQKIQEMTGATVLEEPIQTGIVVPDQRTLYFHNQGHLDHWLNGMLKAKSDLAYVVNINPPDYDVDDAEGSSGDDRNLKQIDYELALKKIKTVNSVFEIEDKGSGLYRVYTPGLGEGTTLRQLDGIKNVISWVYGYAFGSLTAGLFD